MQAYLDNAATTPVSKEVLKAMMPFFSKNFGNSHSTHALGEQARDAVEKSREIIAKKINADADQIIFTSGGTEANSFVIHQSSRPTTTPIEHKSLLIPAQKKNAYFLDVDSNCIVSGSVKKPSDLVSVIHVNNETGTVQNLKLFSDLAKDAKAKFHSDVVQSFCKLPINVKKLDVDFLSLSAHKVHGPKGVGALFIRDPDYAKPLIDGNTPPRSGSENVHGIVGFGAAVKNFKPVKESVLKSFNDISKLGVVNGKRGYKGILNLSFPKVFSSDLIHHLSHQKVYVSSGSACSSHNTDASHVLEAMRLPKERISGAVRFSISSDTKSSELVFAKKVLKSTINILQKV